MGWLIYHETPTIVCSTYCNNSGSLSFNFRDSCCIVLLEERFISPRWNYDNMIPVQIGICEVPKLLPAQHPLGRHLEFIARTLNEIFILPLL